MRRVILIAALAGALGIGGAANAQSDWSEPTEPFRMFDNVYYVGSAGLSAFLFTTPEGHILLDVGVPQNVDMVRGNIEALGFDVADIRYLLNSHAHYDHSGGLAGMKEITGARLIASEGDRYQLENGVYQGWEDRPGVDFPPVEIDRIIADGETVSLGGRTLTANITPGHSPGCTSWGFDVEIGGLSYDALVFCSASVAANRLAPDPQYPGIVQDYRATFARMRTMDVDIYLTPHPSQFGLDQKRAAAESEGPIVYVDSGEKDRRIAEFEAAFDSALARQEAAQ